MSDFLSNFSKENYDGKKNLGSGKSDSKAVDEGTQAISKAETDDAKANKQPQHVKNDEWDSNRQTRRLVAEKALSSQSSRKQVSTVSRFQEEETEYDPTYRKRRIRKWLLIGVIAFIACLSGLFGYYQLTHVTVPKFENKAVSVARSWGTENGVKIQAEQAYAFKTEVNDIIRQSVKAGEKLKKGSILTVTVSLGPDPKELIDLPDFATMTVDDARKWVTANKAENVAILQNFDNKVEDGGFLKIEPATKEQDLDAYKREDRVNVYFSKGIETFEKNIEVPDFTNKPETEVKEWAKTNGVKLATEKVFSDSVEASNVIEQETTKGTKIAKNDTVKLTVSKGKAIKVPDFSQYTVEQAQGLEGGLPKIIKQVYSDYVGYGHFISQSVEAGKEYAEGDDLPNVTVTYSQGKPYIKDLRGGTTEGDLPKLFFDDFQSMGADIGYSVYYVDSAEAKGTVVEMSRYGEFLPLSATIYIGISLGNLKEAAEAPVIPETSSSDGNVTTDPVTDDTEVNEAADDSTTSTSGSIAEPETAVLK